MIRTDRFKLIYITGNRKREDGYITSGPLESRKIFLFDLENDPQEMTNLADRPEYESVQGELLGKLADHMRSTARRPELLPQTDDVHAILDFSLAPRDIEN